MRELRNAINHEYEEDPERLAEFFRELVQATPVLMDRHHRLFVFCQQSYGS